MAWQTVIRSDMENLALSQMQVGGFDGVNSNAENQGRPAPTTPLQGSRHCSLCPMVPAVLPLVARYRRNDELTRLGRGSLHDRPFWYLRYVPELRKRMRQEIHRPNHGRCPDLSVPGG